MAAIEPKSSFISDGRFVQPQSVYQIAETHSKEELVEIVQKMINDRWRLVGGVCVTALPDGSLVYCQALESTIYHDLGDASEYLASIKR